MITLDNGPARGDYVRYIDDLMKSAAVAAASAARAGGDVAGAAVGASRDRGTARSAVQAAAPLARTAATTAARRSDGTPVPTGRPVVKSAGRPGETGFVDPTPASNAAAAAAAVASALMSGEIVRRTSTERSALLSLGAIVLGVALAIVGIVWPAVSLAVIVAGGALATWGVRRLRDAARRLSVAGSPSPGATGR